jgi:hypothetical protein
MWPGEAVGRVVVYSKERLSEPTPEPPVFLFTHQRVAAVPCVGGVSMNGDTDGVDD